MGTQQNDPANATPVYIAPAPAGSGLVPSAVNYAANGSHAIFAGAGIFFGIGVNTGGVTSTLKVYDGVDAGGTLLATYDTTNIGPNNAPGGGYPITTGLFVVLAGGTPADVTVSSAH